MNRMLCVAALGLGLATPAMATEIGTPHTGGRPQLLDLHAGFPVFGVGAALGARYGIPLVTNGFVPPINNSVYVNFGADVYTLSGFGIGIGIPVSMQWNFYFTDEWSAFGEVGLNLFLAPGGGGGNLLLFGTNNIISTVGGRYHLNDSVALHLRLGNPYAAFGVEFAF